MANYNYKLLTPKIDGSYETTQLDISVTDQIVYDVRGWSTFTLQAVQDGAVTVGSLVIKVQVSNDGANPNDFPSGAVTRSTAGISDLLTVVAYGYVHVKITTAGTSGNFRFIAQASRTVA